MFRVRPLWQWHYGNGGGMRGVRDSQSFHAPLTLLVRQEHTHIEDLHIRGLKLVSARAPTKT